MFEEDETEEEKEDGGGASSRFAERKPLADAVPKGEKGKPRVRVAITQLTKVKPPKTRKNSNKEDRKAAAKEAAEMQKKEDKK
ncbi:MAG: hypothetical protein Unbinned80contig1000_23 [Prokaryotic dsDNA virus sp.]|nr:MAG: hypothetical protein Unbinned80contig1000_23 [Prokaryotic dsDNA virus sp.]|tara:strand:- start:13897 stop:14145 length:249 start_codon:yes stop_codon:yes gene_type:complete